MTDLAGNSSNTTTTPSSEGGLSKKDRKKLKKLKKRAALVLVESERSGLLTRSEYEEYKSLASLEQHCKNDTANDKSTESSESLAQPSIRVRKKCAKTLEKVEGSTHRDLISWLLQQKIDRQQQPSKKRSRDERNETGLPIAIPHWASIHNPGTCNQVAVLEVQVDTNMEACRLFLEDNALPNTQIGIATKWFQGPMPKSMSEALLYFSNVKKEKNKKQHDDSNLPSKKNFIKRLEAMLLSQQEMDEEGYPKGLTENYIHVSSIVSRREKLPSPDSFSLEQAKEHVAAYGVRIESYNHQDKSNLFLSTLPNNEERPARVFGLDCEMVQTKNGHELARVTLIEFDEFVGPKTSSKTTVLLDCLVRPENAVLDYLTKHSGITATLLEPISTRLEQVQCALASFLTPADILVGHSLENDLRALHYIHSKVVDTSMVFRPMHQSKRFKFSLRHLSGTLLKKPIQTGSHCSEEDAQAALDLALLKALRGDDLKVPGFGDQQRQSLTRQPFVQESVTAFVGPNDWLERHITKHPNNAHALNYDSSKDCQKAMLAWMTNKRKAHLVWSKIHLETGQPLEVFQSLVTEIVEKLPPTCTLMVALQGELQAAKTMFKRRGACRDPRSSIIWSDKDEEEWKDLLNTTRIGYVQWFSPSTRKD